MRNRMRVLLALALAATWAGSARAATFNVKPTQIHLSAKARSGLLSVRNESNETLRFQLNAFSWNQSVQGEIQLGPTQDVVFFPALLSLAPGEERKIRIGSTVPGGPVEKTYRIVVEEMPPAVKARDVGKSGPQVRVLTRMSIPIFIEPANPSTGGRIEPGKMQSEKVAFAVKNTGNVHFQVKTARVLGLGAGKENLFERSVTGWYVLAGGSRVFEVQPPKGVCARTKELAFAVETEKTTLQTRLDTRSGICGP
jgi:fimbrial chaperone protein